VAKPADPQPAGLEILAVVDPPEAALSVVLARDQVMKGQRLLTAAELAAVGLLGFTAHARKNTGATRAAAS
jgi:hypothetical protein